MPTNKGPVKLVVTLADIHAGSTLALMPPGMVTTNENEVVQNAMQEWLWECWQLAERFIYDVADGDPFALVLNGDLIEGIHHGTKQVWSTDTRDHVEAALQLLSPLAQSAEKLFVIQGTECHTNNQEHTIAKVLNAHPNVGAGLDSKGRPKSYAFERLTLDVNGVRHVFRHHIGTSIRRSLAATQLSVNLVEEQIEAVNNGEPMPRVLCCAHRHKFGTYQDDNGIVVVSPPWQGLTRFGHKVVSQARTKPGVFILDHRQNNKGELPHVHSQLYDTPHPQAVAL